MTDLTLWRHVEHWHREGPDFFIRVSHHTRGTWREALPFGSDPDGGQLWCVYAFIYPNHPHFAAFDGTEDMWQEATYAMPLHGGCTFCELHCGPDGKQLSYQVGADYSHLHDDHFTRMRTPDEAAAVFRDAEKLFDWLATCQPAAKGEPRG